METYWNHNGKYQAWVDKINETMPDMYLTNNKYMNMFIAMSKVYYDIYNNGGCNITDPFYADALILLHEFIGQIKIKKAIKNKCYLEELTNSVFEKLMKEDLTFINHGFWCEWKKRKISMNEHVGDNWIYITCGTSENVIKEFQNRKKNGFEIV